MPASSKVLRARIKSVKNTRKITKAMELVAASKMRKAVILALKTRDYANSLQALVKTLAELGGELTALTTTPAKARKNLAVVLSADRGLAGGLNVNLARYALKVMQSDTGLKSWEVIGVGKKGSDLIARAGVNLIAKFPALTTKSTPEEIYPIAKEISRLFLSGDYQTVTVFYTEYKSGLSQIPNSNQLLPLRINLDHQTTAITAITSTHTTTMPILEPSASALLAELAPLLVEDRLWHLLLEAAASEQAARMMAMRNATDAANEMAQSLSFSYNQARQASITQEIAEISGGKAALEAV